LAAAGAMAATPAAAEEGVKLGLGGYYNTFFWVGDYSESSNDSRDMTNTGLFADGEVHFKGSTTLDNGITFGVQLELEAFQSGDQIDENYIFVEGSFGRMVIGGENTVGYMMQYAAPNVGTPVNSGWITSFVPPPPGATTGFRTPALSTYVDLANDDHALNYYSPRFSGFQVGASFVPAATVNGEGKNFPVQADKETENHNLFSVGANFVESFGEVDIAVAGGFRRAEAAKTGGGSDPQQISTGVNVGFAGFTVGGSVGFEDSDRATNGWGADLGITYATGPWSVGLTGFHSEVDGTGGGDDDELDAAVGAVSYAIGPGITGSFSVMYAKWDPGEADDADGIGGILGMKISF
jgi:outer membrane protein OmpU